MPQEQHVSILYQSETVEVRDFHCRPHTDALGPEEWNTAPSFAFPRSGLFLKHVRGSKVLADPNQVVFFNAAEPYRVSHPDGCGDDCTVFAIAPGILTDIVAVHDRSAAEKPESPFAFQLAPSEPRVDLSHRRLRRAMQLGTVEPLCVDQTTLEIAESIIGSGQRRINDPPHRGRLDTRRAHEDLVEEARILLACRYTERLALSDVARAVHSSPYHLCRLFRLHAGMTLHRYQVRLRLRAALERIGEIRLQRRLNDGRYLDADLTTLALDLGFSSHSHFTMAFHRELGLSPSEFRQCLSVSAISQMSKNLKD